MVNNDVIHDHARNKPCMQRWVGESINHSLSNCLPANGKRTSMQQVLLCFIVVRSQQRLEITRVVCVELPLSNFFGGNPGGKMFNG